jgi:N-acetylglucosamine-6-phosphate deacetylase
MGIPFEAAVKMATETPARLMGLKHKGKLEPEYDADILLINDKMEIEKVIIKGEVYYER